MNEDLINKRKFIVDDLLKLSAKTLELGLIKSHNIINDLLLMVTYEIDVKLGRFKNKGEDNDTIKPTTV
jgi:hypothetical protein